MTTQRSTLCPGALGLFEREGLESGGSQNAVESFCATRSESVLCIPALYRSSSKQLESPICRPSFLHQGGQDIWTG